MLGVEKPLVVRRLLCCPEIAVRKSLSFGPIWQACRGRLQAHVQW